VNELLDLYADLTEEARNGRSAEQFASTVYRMLALSNQGHEISVDPGDGTFVLDGVSRTDEEIEASSVVVYIEEEYGYRYWVWHTGFSATELAEWWQKLDSVMRYFYHTTDTLPGLVLESVNCPVEDLRAVYKDDKEANIEAYIGSLARPTFHEANQGKVPTWFCHMHCDDDSLLVDAEGNRITHAGHVTDEMGDDDPVIQANNVISEQASAEYMAKLAEEHAESQ
jgi:FAD/FMN-containing dehydrogenase